MTTTDRIRETVAHYLGNLPIVTRRTMLARERNAFQLGVDYGTHVGRSSHQEDVRPARRA